MSALPPGSDINLLGYRERIVDLDTKISDSAFDLRVLHDFALLAGGSVTSVPTDLAQDRHTFQDLEA